MSDRTQNLRRAVFRQGPQGNQPGFPRRLRPEEPQLSAKGIAIALADGISSSDVSQVASAVGGHRLPRGLLLHLRRLVGQDIGPARADRHQLLAAFADAAKPVPLRQGPRLRVHPQRHGHQVHDRASLSRRRHAHLPPARQRARAAHRATTGSGSRRSKSYLGRALGIDRSSRSTTRRCQLE